MAGATYVTDHFPPDAFRNGDALTGSPILMDRERVVVTFAEAEPNHWGRLCFREATCRELGAAVGMIEPAAALDEIAQLQTQVAELTRRLMRIRTAAIEASD